MSHYERPTYAVVARQDGYEVRRYDSFLVAETIVPGSCDATGPEAFGRLAGFIFGANSQGARMRMTVPVMHEQVDESRHRYRFVMEGAYTEDTLPSPDDPRVAVVRIPEGHCAALPYRGGERRFRRAATQLVSMLRRDGVPPADRAVRAVYDGPQVPAPFRRNEVLVPVLVPRPGSTERTSQTEGSVRGRG